MKVAVATPPKTGGLKITKSGQKDSAMFNVSLTSTAGEHSPPRSDPPKNPVS
jgi:hypothetical protein